MNFVTRLLMVLIGSLVFALPPAIAAEAPAGNQGGGEITTAFEALKSYTYERKAEFLHWAEARSKDLDRQIAALQVKIKASGGKASKELKAAERDLQRERRELGKRMTTIRKSSSEAWEDAKWGLSAAFDKMDQAYQRAVARFEEKPAPPP